MPAKLSTTVGNVSKIVNKDNATLILQFYEFMQENGTSERHQNNNLKTIIAYSNYIGLTGLTDINSKDQILSFLQTKIKNKEDDPDQRWITTYNDYLHRIKHFFRWLHNKRESLTMEHWKTPLFMENLKPKKTKRLSPYSEIEIWDKNEFLSIIKYEPYKRNKAALALMWDLNARNHEITLLKIKNIRLKEKYGEGEIPFESKTGSGPLLLTLSFPYVRDWLNEHPFKNEPNARLVCNLHTGAPIRPEALRTMMNQLKTRIFRLLKTGEIKDQLEREKLLHIITNKRFNPYCIRHSSISCDSDFLPEYALKKKVRWSMNSRQGARYIKTRMGDELRNRILEYNGIYSNETNRKIPSVVNCPRCELVNQLENKFCSKCSYPLVPSAYDEIKSNEELRLSALEKKYEQDLEGLKSEVANQFSKVFEILRLHPELTYIKPSILRKIGS